MRILHAFVLLLLLKTVRPLEETVDETAKDTEDETLVEELDEKEAPNPFLVTVEEGTIRGKKDESFKGKEFYSFTNIPYAEPPVGNLRFMPPKENQKFSDELDATQEIKLCPQVDPCFVLLPNQPLKVAGQEDCLYLNVFTPNPNPEKLLPVMVYIHGGGYFFGHSGQYPPHILMNKDIVLVTINYRLGVLGFLSTEDDVLPGNMGLRDQQMAMSWIQKNIHKFGGLNTEVTLFGESAGASSIHFQMMSPTILGKFKRVILQSGTAIAPWGLGANHLNAAAFFGQMNDCHLKAKTEYEVCSPLVNLTETYNTCVVTNIPREELLKCLQNIDVDNLALGPMAFFQFSSFPLLFGPRVDGVVIPQHPATILKEDRFKSVDMMIGFTRDEGSIFTKDIYGNEHLRSRLKMDFQSVGPVALDFGEGDVEPLQLAIHIADHYMGDVQFSGEQADNVTAMFGDRIFWYPIDTTIYQHAKNTLMAKKKIFSYEFAYRGEQSVIDTTDLPILKNYVSHVDDLIYLFGKFDTEKCHSTLPLSTPSDVKMSELMVDMWTNFAIHGHPTPPDYPVQWEPFTKKSPQWLEINTEPKMVSADAKAKIREYWRDLPLLINRILFPERIEEKLSYHKNSDTHSMPPNDEKSSPDSSEGVKTDEAPENSSKTKEEL